MYLNGVFRGQTINLLIAREKRIYITNNNIPCGSQLPRGPHYFLRVGNIRAVNTVRKFRFAAPNKAAEQFENVDDSFFFFNYYAQNVNVLFECAEFLSFFCRFSPRASKRGRYK